MTADYDPIKLRCTDCGEVTSHYTTTRKCIPCDVVKHKQWLADESKKRRDWRAEKARKKKVQSTKHDLKLRAERRRKSRKKARDAEKKTQEYVERKAEEKLRRAATIKAKQATKEAERQRSAQEMAAQELANRELCRRRLLPFVLRRESSYLPGWVHRDICQRLEKFSEQVVNQESPRLMLFMPPRHGKSMLVSEMFPAWHIGRNPNHEIIATSYAAALATSFSRRVQDIMLDDDFRSVFPGVAVDRSSQSVEDWRFTLDGRVTRGGYRPAGVGGPISGRGMHVGIIDDPVKNREEADSQTQRQTVKDWYTSTFYTRLMPGGGIVVVLTRWHDDDLAGWLIQRYVEAEKEAYSEGMGLPQDIDKWEVINYPAIATENEPYRKAGEALHAERYDERALARIKKAVGPRDWAALYQQTPVVEEGAYFTRDSIRYYSSPPQDLDIYAAADLAISKAESADYSVILVVGLDANDDIYVLREYRGRWESDEIVDKIFEVQREWKPRSFGIERGHISMALGPYIEKRIREERVYELNIEELKPGRRDKELRARPIQGRMNQGKVHYPQGSDWVVEHVNELLRFPFGVKDDRVDAVAWIGQMLVTKMFSGGPKPRKKKSWRDKLAKHYASQGGNSPMAA